MFSVYCYLWLGCSGSNIADWTVVSYSSAY